MTRINLQHRLGVALAVGLSGGLVAQAITGSAPLLGPDWGFCVCAAVGAFIAGFVLAPGFGIAGVRGWAIAGLTFIVATLLGAAVAVLFLPLEGFLARVEVPQLALDYASAMAIAPLFVLSELFNTINVLLPWLGSILCIHLLAQYLRRPVALNP